MENKFEKASQLKLRYTTSVGNVTTEDLWDMPLTGRKVSLDTVAKDLNRQIKESEEESFVVKQSTVNSVLSLKFEIVKHIISVKMAVEEAKENYAKEKQRKQKIASIIASKEDESLEQMSLEELKKLL